MKCQKTTHCAFKLKHTSVYYPKWLMKQGSVWYHLKHYRERTGIIDAIGSIFKSITYNLNAQVMVNNIRINKISKDELILKKKLLKRNI